MVGINLLVTLSFFPEYAMSVQCRTLLCSCHGFSEIKETNRNIIKGGIEGARSWVDSMKMDPDSSVTIKMNLVPLHQVGRKMYLKNTFCLYVLRAGKAKTEGPPATKRWSQKLSKEQQPLFPWFSVKPPCFCPVTSWRETRLFEGISGLSPHPLPHSFLWYLVHGTFVT